MKKRKKKKEEKEENWENQAFQPIMKRLLMNVSDPDTLASLCLVLTYNELNHRSQSALQQQLVSLDCVKPPIP